tara:strand:+ start:415 stop:786 length:372 start_codon:yes stop_codon:yes gene_type:complete
MVFAAVPKDVTIEKITTAEKVALDEYLGRESRSSIFQQLASNEKIPSLIAGAALFASLPKLLSIIIPILAKQIPEIPSDVSTAIDTGIFIKDLNEAVSELILPGGGILFKGETLDFYDKYVKK